MGDETQIDSLGNAYPVVGESGEASMKERILHESTLMFAEKGYHHVSVKEIAHRVGLKPASLYNHYKGKKELWAAVLDHIEELYMCYFQRLEQTKRGCSSFEEALEAMFAELKQVVNIYTYYCFSLVQTEQFHDKRAEQIVLEVFFGYSIDFLTAWYDDCVACGWVEPFDTRTVSTMLMHCVMSAMHMRVHEHLGHGIPFDITESHGNLQRLILTATGLRNSGCV